MLPYSKYYVLGAIRIYYRDLVSIGMCFKKQSHLGIPIQTWVLDLTAWSMDHIRAFFFRQYCNMHVTYSSAAFVTCTFTYPCWMIQAPTHSQQLQLFNIQLLSSILRRRMFSLAGFLSFFLFCETENETDPETDPPNRKPMTVFVAEWALPHFPTIDEKVRKFPEKGRTEDSCNET